MELMEGKRMELMKRAIGKEVRKMVTVFNYCPGNNTTMAEYGETASEKFVRKARESPFMIVGLVGLMGVVGAGIYGFRNRQIKTSVYLIHMRVAAQGSLVLCLTAGICMNIYKEHIAPKMSPPSIEDKKKD
ncbi:hypothetical protein Pcinc_009285 [Petrolisthes cinctipes]|uniref:HIG1 domain-containing protein n=1 Tax=Petrolisthes cinctipes TaxID=88211 RepID=A0AAE1KYN0_PETCI|nr:hypothetical protein Pcinc_009285 [Petrolisthes cinctipes]